MDVQYPRRARRPRWLPTYADPVLVLLPPSEGKATRRRGRPVDVDALSFPDLTDARLEVLRALATVSADDDACAVLGVGESLHREVSTNGAWETAPALPASALYTGVLYDALDLAGLGAAGRRRAASRLVVVSAVWGALRPGDRVPPYRLSMGVNLPEIGPLAGHWRAHLDPVLTAEATGLVVDCRSATYAAAWRPRGDVAARTVAVRVLLDDSGRRTVVSHMAKHTRGLVARHLLERGGREPRTPHALADAIAERFEVELGPPGRDSSRVLDVVVRG